MLVFAFMCFSVGHRVCLCSILRGCMGASLVTIRLFLYHVQSFCSFLEKR